ncbi:unnamed protein product [Calicophoron daubneyi]|uniref:2Fe-2S ferredoxin-type domain-containing protein n=1 Tax=Calicophoron daubneyi TaxID=300641 RepID=A0AAV2TDS5_CALDB
MFSRLPTNLSIFVRAMFLPGFRGLRCTRCVNHGEYEKKGPERPEEIVHVNVIGRDGVKRTVTGKVGDNLMYLIRHYGIEVEGACEASLACSTCHVYIGDPFLDRLPPPVEAEEDMLDQAVFLKENSRLSCQVILTKELDGIEVTLPKATRNFYVDGHVPKPH